MMKAAMQQLQGNNSYCFKLIVQFMLLIGFAVHLSDATGSIGVNYGTLGNNLPTATQVANLLLTTTLRNVKIYNPDPAIMQAFANTNIKLIVGVPTEAIPILATNATTAQAWLQSNVVAYMPATQVTLLAVGNEVLINSPSVSPLLLPAMTNLHTALATLNLTSQISVGTPHNLQVLERSFPPSSGTFRSNITADVQSLLAFLNSTGGTLMANVYPYFAYRNDPGNVSLPFALFATDNTSVITDANTGLHYTNMLDAQLDAVYSAMERLGYRNIPILVSETGWPSGGDPGEVAANPTNAQTYNENLIKYVAGSKGTPLRPGTTVDAYIFALFNENLKPGMTSERFFGLFNANKTPAYNLDLTPNVSSPPILNPNSSAPLVPTPVAYPPPTGIYPPPAGIPPPPAYIPPPPAYIPPPPAYIPPPPAGSPPPPAGIPPPPTRIPPPAVTSPGPAVSGPAPPGDGGKTWCVAKPGSGEGDVMRALEYACGEGAADCAAIQAGGACYTPNSLQSHASVAFNSYYQKMGRNYWNCYFGGTAVITISDPSYAGCSFH